MPHYGLLRDYRFEDLNTADDIRGASIYGRNDEKLGKVKDVIFDHSTGAIRYLVVDAGGWLSHKYFLVPPHRLHASADHDGDFVINADKEQIQNFPPYNEGDLDSEDRWKDYEKKFDEAWSSGPVQHREGSDHDITPTPDEMPEEPGSIGSQLSPSERAEIDSRIIPAGDDEVTIQNSGSGIGGRWLTFEDRLRQRRRDITSACTSCTVGPASDRSDDSATQERNAI
ncbi:MAG TPA: PRC-barrel domain-containing protein [Terriglobales bacterium]|nr:PRC-barrel domain-containing protein [Terriglobales bacterium]